MRIRRKVIATTTCFHLAVSVLLVYSRCIVANISRRCVWQTFLRFRGGFFANDDDIKPDVSSYAVYNLQGFPGSISKSYTDVADKGREDNNNNKQSPGSNISSVPRSDRPPSSGEPELPKVSNYFNEDDQTRKEKEEVQSLTDADDYFKWKSSTEHSPENPVDLSKFNKEYILKGLARLYRKKILPLELSSRFGTFHSPPLSPADFDAPPLVLLLGPYSVGKVRNQCGTLLPTAFRTRDSYLCYPGCLLDG